VIAQRLHSDFAAIAQRFRGDNTRIVEQMRSYREEIAQFFGDQIAKQMRGD
jgi:hypothetical protein